MAAVGVKRKRAAMDDDKSHACTWPGCGKSFAAPSKLDVHKRVHTPIHDQGFDCNCL
jgi:hypothetical protein